MQTFLQSEKRALTFYRLFHRIFGSFEERAVGMIPWFDVHTK